MIYAIAQLFWGHQRPVPLIPSHLYPYTPPFRSRSIPSIDTLHLTPENVCATLAATSNFMPRTLEIYGNLKISPAAFRGELKRWFYRDIDPSKRSQHVDKRAYISKKLIQFKLLKQAKEYLGKQSINGVEKLYYNIMFLENRNFKTLSD